MNFLKKYWSLGVIALMVITIIGCFAYIFHRINEKPNEKPLGVQGEMVNPYVLYNTTSTQSATSTAWFGDVNPQVSGLYNLGISGKAWNNITASGTISATTISATTMSPTNVTWTNATGTNIDFTSATGSSLLTTSSTIGTLGFGSATGSDLYSTVGRFRSIDINDPFTGTGASNTVLSVNGSQFIGNTLLVATTSAGLPQIRASGAPLTGTGIRLQTISVGIDISGSNIISLDSTGLNINSSKRIAFGINNVSDYGSASLSGRDIYASGTVYGSGAVFGQGGNVVTSTVWFGTPFGIRGEACWGDSDGTGATCQTCNNGSCSTFATSTY